MARLTDKERARIVSLLKEGKSQNSIAKKVKRSPDTVNRIAKAEGIVSDIRTPKKAIEASKAYAEERRLEIIGKGLDKADDLLERIQEAKDLKEWSIALGTLVDKARLETGEVTGREERLNGDIREKQFSNLFSQLDAYRTGFNDRNGEGDPVESIRTERPDS